jgi:hypothetical protein
MTPSMKSRTKTTGLVSVATAAALLVGAGDARAHGDVDVDRPTIESHGEVRVEGRAGEHAEEAGGEHEDRYELGLDMVLGWGKVPFAVQNLPTTNAQALTYTRADQTPSDVQSFLLQGSAEVAEHVEVGFRLPFTFASFSPEGSVPRSATSLGNLELEGAYSVPLGRGLKLVAALGVALPTAEGQEIPAGLVNQSVSGADASAYDRWSLSRAAAFARGYEDNALFEPHRLGLVPKVALAYRARRLSVEPYVKVENLIGTSTLLDASYVGELVGGLRVGYRVLRHVEVALRGWVNVGFAGTADDKVTAAALEPMVAFPLGPVRPYAGVIIPLTGPPSDNGYVGVRIGLSGSF